MKTFKWAISVHSYKVLYALTASQLNKAQRVLTQHKETTTYNLYACTATANSSADWPPDDDDELAPSEMRPLKTPQLRITMQSARLSIIGLVIQVTI